MGGAKLMVIFTVSTKPHLQNGVFADCKTECPRGKAHPEKTIKITILHNMDYFRVRYGVLSIVIPIKTSNQNFSIVCDHYVKKLFIIHQDGLKYLLPALLPKFDSHDSYGRGKEQNPTICPLTSI